MIVRWMSVRDDRVKIDNGTLWRYATVRDDCVEIDDDSESWLCGDRRCDCER
jgi:hypothetical protein